MELTIIDPGTFAELKENMGADFIGVRKFLGSARNSSMPGPPALPLRSAWTVAVALFW